MYSGLKSLLGVCIMNIFSQCVASLFPLSMAPLEKQNLLIFGEVQFINLSTFHFIVSAFVSYLTKLYASR